MPQLKNKQHEKMDKEEENKRGTLWHFLENECGRDERELVRDFLLPTAAALALSLPQVRIASQCYGDKNLAGQSF